MRPAILGDLAEADDAPVTFLRAVTGLIKGNLGAHAAQLAAAFAVRKRFRGREPVTCYRLADSGRAPFLHRCAVIAQWGERAGARAGPEAAAPPAAEPRRPQGQLARPLRSPPRHGWRPRPAST